MRRRNPPRQATARLTAWITVGAAALSAGIAHAGRPYLSGGPGIGHARDGGRYNLYAALGLNF
jgi:hypothetical protein